MAESRFVPAGANETSQNVADEWARADTEIEANRQRMDESQQEHGKSLYETLQANKAAKQEAFEESIRLKNQFRSLDEDEADFLDSVLESTRAQEAAIRKETTEQLDIFRKHQEEAEKTAKVTEVEIPENEENWVAGGKKRRKVRDKEQIRGVKLRKSSSDKKSTFSHGQEAPNVSDNTSRAYERPKLTTCQTDGKSVVDTKVSTEKGFAHSVSDERATTVKASQTPLLGLEEYSSDDSA